jgi:signal transduction histidine kinase
MDRWLENFARANFRRSSDTAHDLKTPLNVAVLNLELLRMRVNKLTEGEKDEKLVTYARSIEVELRRMARIFDTFFLLSTPPKADEPPALVDAAQIGRELGAAAGYSVASGTSATVLVHEARLRQAFQLFFDGAAKIMKPESRKLAISAGGGELDVTITGEPATDDLELPKVFKFYYTDPAGEPDLALATSRLIVETYGGEIAGDRQNDRVMLRLRIPTEG